MAVEITEITWDLSHKNLRDDLRLVPLAWKLGYKVFARNPLIAGIPHDSLVFELNETSIWMIKNGWRAAEIINNRYCNHRTHFNLEEALRDDQQFKAFTPVKEFMGT